MGSYCILQFEWLQADDGKFFNDYKSQIYFYAVQWLHVFPNTLYKHTNVSCYFVRSGLLEIFLLELINCNVIGFYPVGISIDIAFVVDTS